MARSAETYFIQKLEGQKPKLENPQAVEEFWNQAPAGRYTSKISKVQSPKSYQQVKTIMGYEYDSIIAQSNDIGLDVSSLLKYLLDGRIPKGQGITRDFLHELAYLICPINDEEGRRVTLSKMTTEQAAQRFDALRNILAPLGIDVRDPNPLLRKQK